MKTDVITLLSRTTSVDRYGDPVITETPRTVFCEPLSVTQSEFYQAQAAGLKPELKFRISDALDYQGELFVKYKNVRYHVLRTYAVGHELELVCYREVNPS